VSANGGNPTIPSAPNLQSIAGQQVNYPSVSVAQDGVAFAVWSTQPTDGGSSYTTKTANFDPGSQSWSSVTDLSDGGPDVSPQAAQVVAYNGGAFAGWLQTIGSIQIVFGAYYNQGWGRAGTPQSDQTLGASNLAIAGDLLGDVLLVWESQVPGAADAGPQIYAAYLPASGAFPPPVAISNAALVSTLPQVALSTGGLYGAAAWSSETVEPDGGIIQHVFASTFESSRTQFFDAPVQLDVGGGAAYPAVGVAANGDTFAVWQEVGSAVYRVVSSTYTRDAGTWGTPVTLDSDPTHAVYGVNVAVDPGGNAIAAWLKQTDTAGLQMFGGRYTQVADAGWHGTQQLTVGTDPVVNIEPVLVVDALGHGFALETRNPPNNLYYLEFIQFQ